MLDKTYIYFTKKKSIYTLALLVKFNIYILYIYIFNQNITLKSKMTNL